MFSPERFLELTFARWRCVLSMFLAAWLASPPALVFAQKKSSPTPVEQLTGQTARGAKPGFDIPPGVNVADGLSEREAVAIALWNNATLHADLAVLGLARADLVDAGLLRNPILSVILPIGPYPQFESAISFPLEVFWQRRKRVEAATLELNRVAKSLEQNALNLIRDVRLAYAEWIISGERARLAAEAVDLRAEIVKLTNVRLRVGDIGGIEATIMRLDESLAVEQSSRFTREVAISRDRLRRLLGMTGQPEKGELYPDLRPSTEAIRSGIQVSFTSAAEQPLEKLLTTAFESRPDLRAATLAIETAAKRAKWEHSRIGALAGLLNIKQGAGVPFSVRPGLSLEAPIFNRNQGGIGRADAEVARATLAYVALRQQIAGEVQDNLNLYQQSRAALEIWQTQTVPLALENVELARGSFTRGDQSYLFVLDASRRVTEVRQREVELNADVARASINLDRSIGQQVNGRDDVRP